MPEVTTVPVLLPVQAAEPEDKEETGARFNFVAAPEQLHMACPTDKPFPHYISGHNLQGCWCGVCPGIHSVWKSEAKSADELEYSGLAFLCHALPIPFKEMRTRKQGTNEFYKGAEPKPIIFITDFCGWQTAVGCSWVMRMDCN
eukprot:TRINITY_DN2869_c1_g1_i1.p1 TRINITY_DN2869_c1_g1~~TRINITY_DN2869_c1_g1_i1.p1  ORF type:complete len:144 (+),score=26.93 TRINITY_DN2869_c1_g1_i1:133-564(+)